MLQNLAEPSRMSQNHAEFCRISQNLAELSSSVIFVCHVNFSRRLEAESAAFSVLFFPHFIMIFSCRSKTAAALVTAFA
jgi:hypothetical protein